MLEMTRVELEPFPLSGPIGWCVVVPFSTRSGPFRCCCCCWMPVVNIKSFKKMLVKYKKKKQTY